LCTSKQLNEGLFGWKQQVGSAQLRLMVVVGDGWVVLYHLHKKLGYRLCDFMSKDEVHKPRHSKHHTTHKCVSCAKYNIQALASSQVLGQAIV
jgi:hypothetical protein